MSISLLKIKKKIMSRQLNVDNWTQEIKLNTNWAQENYTNLYIYFLNNNILIFIMYLSVVGWNIVQIILITKSKYKL